jgi:hypothetical protein
VAHLNLYVPDEVAANLKQEAAAAGVPLSRFLLSLVPGGSEDQWPAGFFEQSCGFLAEDIEELADESPEPTEALKIP